MTIDGTVNKEDCGGNLDNETNCEKKRKSKKWSYAAESVEAFMKLLKYKKRLANKRVRYHCLEDSVR